MKKKKLFHCVVSVRLNQVDKERLDQISRKRKLSKSEYLREEVKNIIVINVPDHTDLDLCPGVDLFSSDNKAPDLSFMDNIADIDLNPSNPKEPDFSLISNILDMDHNKS